MWRLRLFICAAILLTGVRLRSSEIESAATLRLQGRYAEAMERYLELRESQPVQAILGLSRCYEETGDASRAIGVLREADATTAKHPLILSRQAALAFQRGDYAATQAFVDKAIAADAKNVLAKWLAAELHRVAGRLEQAEQGYGKLTDMYNMLANVSRAEDIRVFGWAASRAARWNRRAEDFRVLVNDLLPSALEKDPHYWPAHVDAALLFLEKYNRVDAKSEIDKARSINPHSADVLAVDALLSLQVMEFEAAEKSVQRALEIRADHPRALQIAADLHFASFQAQAALEIVERALKGNPRDELLLGRKAAAYGLLDGMQDGPSERMREVMTAVTARNPHCGIFFESIGDVFDLTRKYPSAAVYYERAAQSMPQLIQVPGKLGMIQMRLGEEGRAGELLKQSFAADPFNVRVKNTLEVLDLLQTYAVIETEHFVIRFDRGQEQVLAEHAAVYLEREVYPQVTKLLGFEPPSKSLFEIFSRGRSSSGHAWFSARMVGLPSIGTVGACAGKIVALASPNEMSKPFNWARVLKHEFIHVVNLQQTHFNIPHWYTEALAVLYEEQPRPPSWNAILARRARADALYNLSNINLAFARPRNFENWTLAYCQAELYAEFMLAEYGEDALIKMLQAYADNITTRQAIKRCFGVELAAFEADYRAYVDGVVADLPRRPEEQEESFAALQRAVNEDPQDATALARLARAHLARGARPKARQAALAALKIDPREQEAAYVMARLYLSIGEVKRAMAMLDARLDRREPHAGVLALLAGLHSKAEAWGQATELYQLGRKRWPHETKWLQALAKLYLQSGQNAKLAEVLRELATLDGDNATFRQKLADLAFQRGDFAEAADWANQSLQISVKDADIHALKGQALLEQEKSADAAAALRTALVLDPSRDAWRFILADAYVQAKQNDKAKAVLEELLERAPDFPGAATLLESIESE